MEKIDHLVDNSFPGNFIETKVLSWCVKGNNSVENLIMQYATGKHYCNALKTNVRVFL